MIFHKCSSPCKDITKMWPGAAPCLSKETCKAMVGCAKAWEEEFKGAVDEAESYVDSLIDDWEEA